MPIDIDSLAFLHLVQIADSALPIGSTAHSFGLEALVAEGYLSVEGLETFLIQYLAETGLLDGNFCCQAHHLSTNQIEQSLFSQQWLTLNDRLSAFKMARESRIASATLGRRLLQLVLGLEEQQPLLKIAQQTAKIAAIELHYGPVFGLVGGILGVDSMTTLLAYLHQTLLSLVSACQRLLPLGQSQASSILWRLKPMIITIAEQCESTAQKPEDSVVFTPLMDVASMRHPYLPTRLFIS